MQTLGLASGVRSFRSGPALTGVVAAIGFFLNQPALPAAQGDTNNAPPPETVHFAGEAPPPQAPLSLWYRRPARTWVEAMPVGNGRLGGMIYGSVTHERLQLNEDTLWAGGPYDPINPEAQGALPEVRKLIFDGKYSEAAKLVEAKVLARPVRQMPYQTVGELRLTFPTLENVSDYRRELDLDSAIARVSYGSGGVKFAREFSASAPDQVIVVRLSADQPGHISFTATYETPQTAQVTAPEDGLILLTGTNGAAYGIPGALQFQAGVRILPEGGRLTHGAHSVSITNANTVTLLIAVATSFKNYQDITGDPQKLVQRQLSDAARKPVDRLRADHVADHQRFFRRVALDLGTSPAMRLPTDERIKGFATGNDPQLAALYFQFGRYLLLGSSRPGTQPANLQGLWNDSMLPPWGSKYTININTEMNYWPADSANLPECLDPLVRMVQDLTLTGARTAKAMYQARGWVAHHNTDLWRAAAPIDGVNSGMWPLGGAWLSLHLWDHYEYTGDKAFLGQVYPALKGASLFFLDTLVEEPTHHWLVTNPSLSPENRHPFGTSLCAAPAMDAQIIRDLFDASVKAAEILGVDAAFRKDVTTARARLAPDQIGRAGQLQEWLEDWDMQAKDVHHRHVSHLFGLYPSSQITLRGTPELAAAARKSLEIRGDKATGWATAWRINLWSRLEEGDHAYNIFSFLLSPERTYPNLFDAHPPFQIDGNFGGLAGIVEMLVQSHEWATKKTETSAQPVRVLSLLPALPKAWPTGSVKGLRARGGFELDLAWAEGKLTAVTVRSAPGNEAWLRTPQATRLVSIKKGGSVSWDGK